ncbi:uncharacterized protein LOC143345656 [Colletes latitarsis]|uniref:uncharacterized protein LOC143345656 n=1 Tax=Colletes latitarsis TaxID=2605962 RepID=UPI004035A4FC
MPWSNDSEASLDTKSIDLHIELNYYSDKKIYSYVAYFHEYTMLVIGATTIIGTETTSALLSHYASGLLHVVRYRIQNAFHDKVVKSSSFERDEAVRGRLIIAIKVHKKVLEYCKLLDNTLGFSYFTLLIMGVFSLSLNLLRLSQARLQTNKYTVAVLEIVIVLAHLLYLFLTNYMGQIIIDSSTKVFTSAYHSRWYLTAVPEQKLFLFMQHRNLRNYSIQIGGLFTPSYEGFSTLVKMSFSYFTVIYSTQL